MYGGTRGFGNKIFRRFKMNLGNPYLLAVLLLFNEKDTWTPEEICAELGIDMGTCERYQNGLEIQARSRF